MGTLVGLPAAAPHDLSCVCWQAYALISAKKGVCGQFDLLCFRNPWGSGEYTAGGWQDGGGMWEQHPDALQELGYTPDPDDGLFWMAKEEAFAHFWGFTVCMYSAETCRRQDTTLSAAHRAQRRAARGDASVTRI